MNIFKRKSKKSLIIDVPGFYMNLNLTERSDFKKAEKLIVLVENYIFAPEVEKEVDYEECF